MKKLSMEELGRISAEEFKKAEKMPLIIVLDDVRSAYNVGSIFRTADAFRVERICLCGITAQPPHKDISKTALGATDSVDWKYYGDVIEAITECKVKNYRIFTIEQADESIGLDRFQPEKNNGITLVFGHEVFGIRNEIMKIADGCIEIPQFGTKHSFNVAVSAGIVLWDIINKMKQ